MTKNEWGLFGSLYFLGMVIGAAIIPRLSDKYGRKPFAISSTLIHIIAAIIMLLTTSNKVAEVMVFICGLSMPGRVFVGYLWMSGYMRAEEMCQSYGNNAHN